MKTAISLPDQLFKRVESAARKEKLSRSALIAKALEVYLQQRRGAERIAAYNAYAEEFDTSLPPQEKERRYRQLRSVKW